MWDHVSRIWFQPGNNPKFIKWSPPISWKCDLVSQDFDLVFWKCEPIYRKCDLVSRNCDQGFRKMWPGSQKMWPSYPKRGPGFLKIWIFRKTGHIFRKPGLLLEFLIPSYHKAYHKFWKTGSFFSDSLYPSRSHFQETRSQFLETNGDP